MSPKTTNDAIRNIHEHLEKSGEFVWEKGLALTRQLQLPGLRSPTQQIHALPAGSAPGLEALPETSTPPPPDSCPVQVMTWSKEHVETATVEDLKRFLETPEPDWMVGRWINVNGLHPYIIELFRQHFNFHSLAAEDVMFVPQRAKVEPYEKHLFIIAHMLTRMEQKMTSEQISFFLFEDTLLTFQEQPGDVWEPIRNRLLQDGSKIRTKGVDYLLYSLVDAVVDHCFPIAEAIGDCLEELEDLVLAKPSPAQLQKIHQIKRQLSLLRRMLWPTRDMVDTLYRGQDDLLDESTGKYFRDVYDHVIQLLDIIETYRELAGSLTDLYMSSISNRMNEIMKVLTIMASLFIPITFLAGVYGMNFEYMPELKWIYSYPVFWIIAVSTSAALLVFFRRKQWI